MASVKEQRIAAYNKIYGVNYNKLSATEQRNADKVMNTAVTKLIASDKWACESLEAVGKRKLFATRKDRNVYIQFANYVREQLPELAEMPDWEVIFKTYQLFESGSLMTNDSSDLPQVSEESASFQTSLESTPAEPATVESHAEINKNENGGNTIMANSNSVANDIIGALNTENGANMIPDTKAASSVSSADTEAAKAVIAETKAERDAFQKETLLSGVICTRPTVARRFGLKTKEQVAAAKEAAQHTGKLRDKADKVRASIYKKSAVVIDKETGKITSYGNLVKDQDNLDNFAAVLDILDKAEANPDLPIAIALSANRPGIKGYIYQTNNASDLNCNAVQMTDMLLDKGNGQMFVKTGSENSRLVVTAITPNESNSGKSSKGKAKNKYAGITSLRLYGAGELMQDDNFVKFVFTTQGAKEKETVKVNSEIGFRIKTTVNGKDRVRKISLPLTIEMDKLELNTVYEAYKPSTAIGNVVPPSAEELNKTLTGIIASLVNKKVDGISSVKKATEKKAEAETAAVASQDAGASL